VSFSLKGCWKWTGGKYRNGYGQFAYNKSRKITAHRYSYELFNGPLKKGLVVAHRCDVRDCVNPDHLFLATTAENLQDMWDKGRGNPGRMPGESNGRSKLTQKTVDRMRKEYDRGGHTYASIGRKFKISETQSTRIIKRSCWIK